MTLSEFKAWFEGFTESMDGPPNAKAWKRIQARVKEISGTAVTERVYVDRYIEPYRRYFYGQWSSSDGLVARGTTSYSAGACTLQNGIGNAVLPGQADTAVNYSASEFDSHKAMTLLGRAEAQSMAA